jgi:hypothetical protein
MGKIKDYSENLWNGRLSTFVLHPFGESFGLEEIEGKI